MLKFYREYVQNSLELVEKKNVNSKTETRTVLKKYIKNITYSKLMINKLKHN